MEDHKKTQDSGAETNCSLPTGRAGGGSLVVVKVGGAIVEDEAQLSQLLKDS